MIGWLLGLLGAGRLWKQILAGDEIGWCAGPVIKNAHGVFDLSIHFKKHP